jgi:dihydrofolate synthase/folylpolyglutamate synthase
MKSGTGAAASSAHASDVVLERLTRLHPKVIDLSLDRVRELLARLGHPEARLPPVVHVAGTNGKGSVIAFLRAMLEAAGHRVHVYTSPHLVRFHERIRVAGRLIEDDRLIALLEECEAVNGAAPITFFEITTAAAFLAFARAPADAALLETGLGGRLDATNVVARPLATAITQVSIDHRQYLGETLAEIAGEKAGILKPGVPCVVAAQEAAAARVIGERARAVGAPLRPEGGDWSWAEDGAAWVFASPGGRLRLPRPALAGPHQLRNAAQAIACLRHLTGLPVSEQAIAGGLAAVEWPARLQRLRRGRLVSLLPADWEPWLDGGHNEGAGKALAAQAQRWRREDAERGRPELPLHLVVGMLNTKDPRAFLDALAAEATSLRAVAIPGERNSLPAETVAEAARAAGIPATPAPSVADALAAIATAGDGAPARALICGSLYLAGSVLRENG